MLFVCKRHVKDGLKVLTVPHVRKINEPNCKCYLSTCTEKADFKLFFSTSSFRNFKHTV